MTERLGAHVPYPADPLPAGRRWRLRFPARVPLTAVSSLDDVAAYLSGAASPVVLLFDVDGTVAPQGAAPAELERLVNQALDRFGAATNVTAAIALSNGAPRGVERMVPRGNKPWTSRRRLGLAPGDAVVVVGDQILTDGLLAWRWGGSFLHLLGGDTVSPPRQRLTNWIGNLLRRLFFKSP